MKLIYRGAIYDYNTLKASSRPTRRTTSYTLSYRGVTYQVIPNSETPAAPVHTITQQLIYRGNTYQVTRTVRGEVVRTPANRPEMALQAL